MLGALALFSALIPMVFGETGNLFDTYPLTIYSAAPYDTHTCRSSYECAISCISPPCVAAAVVGEGDEMMCYLYSAQQAYEDGQTESRGNSLLMVKDIDPCLSNPCGDGGNCSEIVNNKYTCTCPAGYTGDQCQTDIDECSSSPCTNGSCVDEVNGYICPCDDGYNGTTQCETANGICSDLESAVAVAVYDSTTAGMSLSRPYGISICSLTGSVAFADYSGNKIHVMDAELNAGIVIDQMRPYDTTYDDLGFLYVTYSPRDEVYVYDNTGNKQSSFGSSGTGPGQFDGPRGITHNAGVLYVCDGSNKRVQVLHTDGTFIAEFGTPDFDFYSRYIAVDTNIYVSDATGTLFVFSSAYTLINKVIFNESPLHSVVTGIALYNGCLVVADDGSDSIKVFDDSYSLVATIGSYGTSIGQLDVPFGIAVTPLGSIYVADKGNKRVQLFEVP